MLNPPKMKLVEEILSTFDKDELCWLNGFISGRFGAPVPEPAISAPARTGKKITIVYGTQTGNSKRLAGLLSLKAKAKGMKVSTTSLDQYRLSDLQKEELLLIIVSTQGDGEPPAAAKKFYDYIHGTAPALANLKFSVFALGDSSYPLFCKAGEDIDLQLNRSGGQRIAALQKCDVGEEDIAEEWLETVIHEFGYSDTPAVKKIQATAAGNVNAKKTYSGKIISNINLNDRGSGRQTHHIEILAGDLNYLPGDSIGIVPENKEYLVKQVLQLLQVDEGFEITTPAGRQTAFNLLKTRFNISNLPERVVRKYANIIGQQIPSTRISLPDLLRIYPPENTVLHEKIFELLEPITPRLYSISSSQEKNNDEVHITVALDRFPVDNDLKNGLCSDYLTGLPEGSEIEFYIHSNHSFRLPAPDQDIIMIGPGTGIAPFRSFLCHREATGAGGKNWLFFGERNFTTDFLYQVELQNWKDAGLLTRVDLAFSRDQQEKIYVQHRMMERGEEFFDWLSRGAYLYVCGAESPMSIDVERTLVDIIIRHGHMEQAEAVAYINHLQSTGRYLKDVY